MKPEVDPAATIVVCEDDEVTRMLLCEQLSADGFEVLEAEDASAALRRCRYADPDLLLLDLALPDAPGLDVLRAIRGADAGGCFDPELPVVVLTGAGSDDERVRGLRVGADDYLVKPFHYQELYERIRAVLRRGRAPRSGPRRVGPLRVDPATRTVELDGEVVELANKEFELLLALSAEPTRVFTKKELLRDVWGYDAGARTRTLDAHASRLRRKLDPENGRFVVNCWGVPYRYLLSPIPITPG